MAGSSTLDPDNFPPKRNRKTLKGHGTRSGLDSDSDSVGTGEHLGAGAEPDVRLNSDRQVDRVVGEKEAGVGHGLDQAEEARRGRTRYGTKPRKPRGRRFSIKRG